MFVFPSLHDEAGWVVVEAMACGLPVVSLDVGGPPILAGDAMVVAPAGMRVTAERIAQRVSLHFRLDPKELRHRDRQPRLLWPSQVGMFLARELTGLPLPRIGGFFGGRDPSTVRHACRKVEEASERDPAVAGALRQLRAELG